MSVTETLYSSPESAKEMLTVPLPWCLVSNLPAAWVYGRFYGAEACVQFCPWQRETAAGICCSDKRSSSEGKKKETFNASQWIFFPEKVDQCQPYRSSHLSAGAQQAPPTTESHHLPFPKER